MNVVNDLGAVLEQYGDVLRTVCKNHKELPYAKPGNMRLDVSFVQASDDAGSADSGSGSGGSDRILTAEELLAIVEEDGAAGLQELTAEQLRASLQACRCLQAVLRALLEPGVDVSGLTVDDLLAELGERVFG